jgi:D-arabinan exo alpha-(1,3)/(1,5)-arabinofuranosidase (non-reducing end)
MRYLIRFLLFTVFVSGTVTHAELRWEDMVSVLLNRIELARIEDHVTTAGMISSYDRTGGNDDGFSGAYSQIRTEGNQAVLADIQGPGMISRIWTTHTTPWPDAGLSLIPDARLQINLDGKRFPVVWNTLEELFSNRFEPFIKPISSRFLGGACSYVPIPFQKHCTISIAKGALRFYQITFKQFKPGTVVEPFSMKLEPSRKRMIRKTARVWEHPVYRDDVKKNAVDIRNGTVTVDPGSTESCMVLDGPGVISELALKITPVEAQTEFDLIFQFDDMPHPAVQCPVGAFFAAGFGTDPIQSLLTQFDGTTYTAWFPMPFEKKAVMKVRRKSGSPGSKLYPRISWTVKIVRGMDLKGFAEFHADYNPPSVPSSTLYEVCNLKGHGHLAGCHLTMEGPGEGPPIFLEGDEVISVDGREIIHGTGTEDFFNCGWYGTPGRLDRAGTAPLYGFTVFDPPLVSAYRWMISDKIPFKKSLVFQLEQGPTNNTPALYASTVYYYIDREEDVTSGGF